MQRVKVKSNNSPQELLKFYLEQEMGIQDSDQFEGEQSAENMFEAFSNLFDKFQSLSTEYQTVSKQSQSQGARPTSSSARQAPNFNQMIGIQNAVIKLQAWFRKELTLRKIQKDIKSSKAAISTKKEFDTPEEGALREFAQQLQQKKITPEGFYRICDCDYKQTVNVSIFKEQLQKHGLLLSRGQQSRLIMILDEDLEGNITREEYYNALEAYNVSGEKHKSIDGSSTYYSFEHRCLFKLIAELKKKDISFLEMFNACDINDDTRVNISEVKGFVSGLIPDIQLKELHALMNYLDIDKNGVVDKDEFLRQLNRGEQTYKQSQIINKQIAERKMASSSSSNFLNNTQSNNFFKNNQEDDLFNEVQIGGGDQAFFGLFGGSKKEEPVKQKVQDQPPSKSMAQTQQQLTPEMQKKKLIIEKMEKEGLNFQSFFSSLKGITQGGYIVLGSLIKAIDASYPTVTPNERNFLIKDCLVENRKVDYIQLEELFTKFSKNLKPSVSQSLSIIATNIVKRMGSSPQDAIRQFFKAQNLIDASPISDIEFTQMFSGRFSTLSSRELDQAFESVDIDRDGFIEVRDLIEVLLSYTNSTDKTQINVKELSNLIPGFEAMSPRTRCEEVIDYIIGELQKKNMKPLSVFKMADAKNSGGVQAMLLEITFKKVLPHIKNEVFTEAMNAFKLKSNRDIIIRTDFETVFADDAQNKYVPNSQGITQKKPGDTMQKGVQQPVAQANEDEIIKWIKKLDNAMLREGISPSVAFKAADVNHNNLVTVEELRDSIKKLIPSDQISLVELKKIMLALDANGNGVIDEQEFISLFEKARNSTITIIESPQKSKILNQDLYDDKRKQLPVKDQLGQKSQQNQGEQIATIVDAIEQKVQIKKIFSEIPIDEQGKMLITHISRRFKSEQLKDGTTLMPSEYLPIIKTLDQTQSGSVEVKEILKFLDKYCKQNTNCVLDLKYMANFIEFQMKSRNTIQFFLNNTQLKQGTRVMEVNLMSELSKVFGVPMQTGNIIYRLLQQRKGSSDIVLEDICKLIDDFRVVKVDASQQRVVTEAQKLDPQQILEKMAKGIIGMPKKMQDSLNQKLVQVNQTNKLIPYKDFYETFVDEYQLLTNIESKALFQYLKSQSSQNVNGLILLEFQQALQKYTPQQSKQMNTMNQSLNDREPLTSLPQLLQSLEQSLKQPLEKAIDQLFMQDQIPIMSMNRQLLQVQPLVDKNVLKQFCMAIDSQSTGKVQIKDLTLMLKGIKGKYDSQKVLAEIVKNMDNTTYNILVDEAEQNNTTFEKIAFLQMIEQASLTTTKFNSLCLFYDLSKGSDTLNGTVFFQKIFEIRPPTSKSNQSKKAMDEIGKMNSSDKRTVSFKEPQREKDQQKQKQLCQQFVQNFDKICSTNNVGNALKKLTTVLKQIKNFGDAVSKLDSSGKNLIQIEVLQVNIQEIRTLTAEEVMALIFLPIAKNKLDIFEINVQEYVKLLKSLEVTPQIVSQHVDILTKNLDTACKYFKIQGPSSQFEMAEEKFSGTQSLPQANNNANNAKDARLEAKRQKKMAKMKNILSGLRNALKDNKKKEGLINLFNNAPNQKLTYDDFYEYFERGMGIVIQDEAEFDTFEQILDFSNKGRFKFIDFVDFCEKYEIDFKTNLATRKVVAADQREQKGEKLTCGLLQYTIVPERDYFYGVPTILNSEEAALVVAEKIFNSIKDGEEFFDKDFGPKDEEDEEGSALSMYCNGTPPHGYTKPEDVAWIRPEEMPLEKPAQFMDDGAASNDVKQGAIGDCWFIGALSVLATRDDLLRGWISVGNFNSQSFVADEESAKNFSKGVYPPLFHYYRKRGIYVFRFFKEFSWRYVLIDDRLPCYQYTKMPVFGSCTNLHELWVPLLEKAYAKLHGCYETLISGFIDDALNDLTGLVAEKLILHNEQKTFPHKNLGDKDKFWQFLLKRVQEKCMMGCSVSGDVERQIKIDGFNTGIMTGHAYGLVDAFEVPDKSMTNPRGSHRLLRVRNPWGKTEWQGKWGDKSEELEKYKPLLDAYLAKIEDEEERFTPGVEDGTFLINYQNWRDIYNNMYICVDFPQDWSGVRFRSKWDETCSGGVPSPMTEENKVRWAKNPQFKIKSKKDMEIFISLAQPDGRRKREDGSYLKFPYSDLIHPVLFTVLELAPGDNKIQAFDKNKVKIASVLKEHREVSIRVQLPKGSYVIVPSTRNPGEYGEFTLSIYFNLRLKDMNIQRIDKPENEYDIIMEESESNENIQEWKVDLTQQRIKYMMLEEDEVNDSNIQNSGKKNLSSSVMKKKGGAAKNEVEFEDAFPEDDGLIE